MLYSLIFLSLGIEYSAGDQIIIIEVEFFWTEMFCGDGELFVIFAVALCHGSSIHTSTVLTVPSSPLLALLTLNSISLHTEYYCVRNSNNFALVHIIILSMHAYCDTIIELSVKKNNVERF